MAEATQGAVASDTGTTTTSTTEAPIDGAAAPGSTAPSGAETTTTDGGDQPKATTPPPEKTFTQKELDRIVARERREYQRLSREAEDRAYERMKRERGEEPGAREAVTTQPQGEPKPDDFKTPQEWLRAWNRWDRNQADQEYQHKQRKTHEQRSSQEADAYLEERFGEADEEYPDLRARLSRLPVLSDAMLGFVLDTEHGFAVGDFIATNTAEAKKIAALPPAKQVLALADIAAKLKVAPKTNTPPPIVPNDAQGASHQDLSSVKSDEEWAKKRDKAIREKRARGD